MKTRNRALLRYIFVLCTIYIGVPAMAQEPQGKIISLQGRVERQPAAVPTWSLTRILQQLFTADKVRVLEQSRAAILFADESQIRLNAGAELTVKSVKERGGSSSLFELAQGEGWFRTKNPASGMSVSTPAATAAIRGTEINVRVAPDGETVVTVVEGAVDLSNAVGSLTVNGGEEATVRPGQAPTKRTVLNPREAVQWVLYYPTDFSWSDYRAENLARPVAEGFALLDRHEYEKAAELLKASAAGDDWARLGLSGAYLGMGEIDLARTEIVEPAGAGVEAERLAQAAAVSLAVGEVAKASTALESAARLDSRSLRVHTLRSSIALVQNDTKQAAEEASAALMVQPNSVAAHLAAGEALQATGALEEALNHYDAALEVDPGSIRGLVDRTRVLFGSDKKAAAQATIERALAIVPDDAQVLSLQGFIELSSGNVKTAITHFSKAVGLDSSFGEPHLGLGLAAFKQGRPRDGLEENLVATLLDPQISLYQSYLAKAYHQERRFPEGLAVLETAKRLDPNDPTPWLYGSYFLGDMNRFGDALYDLREAIKRNDNRAVYRSRLLLDQDLATKNVSLARAYTKLGLERWGASVALKSIITDFSNASAHIFLADVYGRMPDRLQAQGSELLQYQLLAPVNRNSFSSFNEYTSLFDQPMFSVELYGEGRYPWWGMAEPLTRSGNDRFAHLAFGSYSYGEGVRINPSIPDIQYFGFGQAKIALSEKSDLLINAQYKQSDHGEDQDEVITYGADTSHPVNIQTITTTPDTNNSYTFSDLYVLTGFKHLFGTGMPLVVAAQFERIGSGSTYPDSPSTIPDIYISSTTDTSFLTFDAQAQQVFKIGTVDELITGVEGYYRNKTFNDKNVAYTATDPNYYEWNDFKTGDDWGIAVWVQNDLRLWNRLDITVGLRGQKDVGEHLTQDQNFDFTGIYPALGLSFELSPAVTLRSAIFQTLSAQMFGTSISPTTIAGFAFQRNEEDYTKRTELDLGIDLSRSSLFFQSEIVYQSIEYPPKSFTLLKTSEI
ncbi:MAG TPA: TonB-dependent receptor, partial [Spirochaetia bacterium]|nr:TonB-dependent receptor [Spirochaetia bacterium]